MVTIEQAALHEAGHAVVAHALGYGVQQLDVIPGNNGDLGHAKIVRQAPAGDSKTVARETLAILLAGLGAEKGRPTTTITLTSQTSGGKADIDRMPEVLAPARVLEEETGHWIMSALTQVQRILLERWGAVEALAMALKTQQVLSGETAIAIINEALR